MVMAKKDHPNVREQLVAPRMMLPLNSIDISHCELET